MSEETRGWTRVASGVFEKTIGGTKYTIRRRSQRKYFLWDLFADDVEIDNFFMLSAAKWAAHRHAEGKQ